MKAGIAGCVAAFVLVLASDSVAEPILFTHDSNGSGHLGDRRFSNANIRITAIADTTARQSFDGRIFVLPHISASINIERRGTFRFLLPTQTFVNNTFAIVGFSRTGLDLLNGPTATTFATWKMLTSIGPTAGPGQFLQWANTPILTSGGVLEFADAPANVTFRATVGETVIPEPTSLILLALGLGVARFSRRNSRTGW
jgi:PEP-CTERM motif